MKMNIDDFITALAGHKTNERSYNLYAGESRDAAVRRANLRLYLNTMMERNPRTMLVGEAPGYRGCRLTGVPFASENIILCETGLFGRSRGYCITGCGDNPIKENTAGILWRELNTQGYNIPVIWNIYPFHPHHKDRPDSNRTPSASELVEGKYFVDMLIGIFRLDAFGAVGRKAESVLQKHYKEVNYIRHPSYGGAADFKTQLKDFMERHQR